MNLHQSIPCPSCQSKIPFDVNYLLMGAQFACPNCGSVISLAENSKETVKQSLDDFESLRKKVAKMKKK